MSKKIGTIIKSAVTAAIGGVAVGILVAPKSGKETRDDIKQKAKDINNKRKETISDAKSKVQDTVDNTKARVNESVENVKDKAMDAKNKIMNKQDEVTNDYTALKDELKDFKKNNQMSKADQAKIEKAQSDIESGLKKLTNLADDKYETAKKDLNEKIANVRNIISDNGTESERKNKKAS